MVDAGRGRLEAQMELGLEILAVVGAAAGLTRRPPLRLTAERPPRRSPRLPVLEAEAAGGLRHHRPRGSWRRLRPGGPRRTPCAFRRCRPRCRPATILLEALLGVAGSASGWYCRVTVPVCLDLLGRWPCPARRGPPEKSLSNHSRCAATGQFTPHADHGGAEHLSLPAVARAHDLLDDRIAAVTGLALGPCDGVVPPEGSKGTPAWSHALEPLLGEDVEEHGRRGAQRLAVLAHLERLVQVGLGQVERVEHRQHLGDDVARRPGRLLLLRPRPRSACGSSRSRPGCAGVRAGTRPARVPALPGVGLLGQCGRVRGFPRCCRSRGSPDRNQGRTHPRPPRSFPWQKRERPLSAASSAASASE